MSSSRASAEPVRPRGIRIEIGKEEAKFLLFPPRPGPSLHKSMLFLSFPLCFAENLTAGQEFGGHSVDTRVRRVQPQQRQQQCSTDFDCGVRTRRRSFAPPPPRSLFCALRPPAGFATHAEKRSKTNKICS